MKHYDAVVIGGGILGCTAARNLRRWNISVALLEQENDVCRGITRANSAICYAGYDNKPGSLKAELTVRGNANMEKLCLELDVPFSRCGSLLVTYDTQAIGRLEKKLHNGIQNGVPGIQLLSGAEAEAMEPSLRKGIQAALYAPTTGTVNPWKLGIAACENAVQNGAEVFLNTKVTGIRKTDQDFVVETDGETFSCKLVFNCAGLSADKVQELMMPSSVYLQPDGAEYLVFDPRTPKPDRVIFVQGETCGKGITAIPCTEGNLLISGIRKPMEIPFGTTAQGLEELQLAVQDLLPETHMGQIIRSFGAVRPNPERGNGENLGDFCIENPVPGFYSLIGIKTPGLTASNELTLHLAEQGAAYLGAAENPDFDPYRKAIRPEESPDYYEIICQCGHITKGEILEAIRRGATTVEAVKRRVDTGMGRCQGSRCSWRIAKILKETGANPEPLF